MYKSKDYGIISCKEEYKILAELERDLSKKEETSISLIDTIKAKSQLADNMHS